MGDFTDDMWADFDDMEQSDPDYEDVGSRTQYCPYCGAPAGYRDSSVIYGRSYGIVLICSNYPDCDAYVGCHRGSGLPKGTMANAELREWRKLAHAKFDALWRGHGKMSRASAYEWLARTLKMDPDRCHIGMMRINDCRRVIEVASVRIAPPPKLAF